MIVGLDGIFFEDMGNAAIDVGQRNTAKFLRGITHHVGQVPGERYRYLRILLQKRQVSFPRERRYDTVG